MKLYHRRKKLATSSERASDKVADKRYSSLPLLCFSNPLMQPQKGYKKDIAAKSRDEHNLRAKTPVLVSSLFFVRSAFSYLNHRKATVKT